MTGRDEADCQTQQVQIAGKTFDVLSRPHQVAWVKPVATVSRLVTCVGEY